MSNTTADFAQPTQMQNLKYKTWRRYHNANYRLRYGPNDDIFWAKSQPFFTLNMSQLVLKNRRSATQETSFWWHMPWTPPLGRQCGFSFLEASSPVQKTPLSYQKSIKLWWYLYHHQSQHTAGGLLVNWLSLCVKLTLCRNRTKYILMAIQWQIYSQRMQLHGLKLMAKVCEEITKLSNFTN